MLIVVEGVDASGKTTLLENSRHIRGRYFVLLRHSCRPLVPDDIGNLLKLIDGQPVDLILDRHPLISEPIYGPILRKKNLVTEWIAPFTGAVDSWIKEIDRVIYCRPPITAILTNLNNNPQLAGVEQHLEELLYAYDRRMAEIKALGVEVVKYDYKRDPVPDLRQLFFGEKS